MVRGDGIIVGTSADPVWALNALGVDPPKIIHQSMAHYVDVFADVSRGLPGRRLTPTLVTGGKSLCCASMCHTVRLMDIVVLQ